MEELIQVLMRRDEITREEAIENIKECKQAMYEAIEEGDDAEEVFSDYLGLEPDYLFAIFP